MLEQCGFGRFVDGRERAKVGLEGGVSPVFREGVREDAEGVRILGFLLVGFGWVEREGRMQERGVWRGWVGVLRNVEYAFLERQLLGWEICMGFEEMFKV